jgi:hypothetical protein
MYVMTTWKVRPLSPEQSRRMMDVWAKSEAKESESTSAERVCWFISGDGSSGVTVSKVTDPEAANALALETSLALSEFLELDTRIALDLDSAMPSISGAMEYLPT